MRTVKVVVLTQKNCVFCDLAQSILKALSAEYPIEMSTLSFDTLEGQELALSSGILFAPGILMDGEAVCYGRPSEKKLRKEFEHRLGGGEGKNTTQ